MAALKIFASYAPEDRVFAHALSSGLLREGYAVYPNGEWPRDVAAAIGSADAMVVLVSRAALASPFVRREIELGITAPNLRGRLFSVVLEATNDAPWILKHLRQFRGSKGPSALASSIGKALRKRADGRPLRSRHRPAARA